MAKLYGKGSITELDKGKKYRIELSLGRDPVTGKYRKHRETFLGSRRECELRVDEIRREREFLDKLTASGVDMDALERYGITPEYIFERGLSVGEVIAELDKCVADEEARAKQKRFDEWAEEYLQMRERRGVVRPATLKQNRVCARHLSERIGDMYITEIKPRDVDNLYAQMTAEGLGQSVVVQSHKLLRQIMAHAVKNGLILFNPVDRDRLEAVPKLVKSKRKSLERDEYTRLLSICSSGAPTALHVAVYLGGILGARLGEVLGLQWKHFHDGERPFILVEQQYRRDGEVAATKTGKDGDGGRIIPIDASSASLLRSWRSAQREALLEFGIESGLDTPIVTNEVGTWQDHARFERKFRQFCVDHGYGRFVDEDGTRIVELCIGDDAAPYDGCVILWHDAEGWPCDAEGKRYSRTYKKPKIKKRYQGLVYHELRHSKYSIAGADGMPKKVAQALGGWKSSKMLDEIYEHALDEDVLKSASYMERYTTPQQ